MSLVPGGTDPEALQGWLLKSREDIKRLCASIKTFINWLSNRSPPWAAYHAFMSGRLIVLYKQPGVCLFRVGETWRRLFSKCVLRATVPESTNACQDDQLYAGLKAGIDGTVHGVQEIWDTKLTSKDWGFLIIESFKEIN